MKLQVPRRLPAVLLLALAALCLARCQEKLPAAPDTLVEGITVYEHANYEGASALLTGDAGDLAAFKGPCEHSHYNSFTNTFDTTYDWTDCISSIKVAPGWRATVFEDSNFHDDALEVTADLPNLAQVRGDTVNDTWNDCISSIRVRRQ